MSPTPRLIHVECAHPLCKNTVMIPVYQVEALAGIVKCGGPHTTPVFTVEIRTEGDWMSTGPLSNNLAYLLENVAGKLLQRGVDDEVAILDPNGNTIGRYTYNA